MTTWPLTTCFHLYWIFSFKKCTFFIIFHFKLKSGVRGHVVRLLNNLFLTIFLIHRIGWLGDKWQPVFTSSEYSLSKSAFFVKCKNALFLIIFHFKLKTGCQGQVIKQPILMIFFQSIELGEGWGVRGCFHSMLIFLFKSAFLLFTKNALFFILFHFKLKSTPHPSPLTIYLQQTSNFKCFPQFIYTEFLHISPFSVFTLTNPWYFHVSKSDT